MNLNTQKLRFPIPQDFIETLQGKIIKQILRRGKYLLLNFNSDITLLVHLGMTGVFKIEKKYVPEKHDHIIFNFSSKFLIYNDIRRFGFFKIYNRKELNNSSHLIKLGIEPLKSDLNYHSFLEKILNKSQSIKQFLMDQKNIAGLGNIYCSEILFDTKILPTRNVNDLKNFEIKKLVLSIKKVLKLAILKGGTSLRDFKEPMGKIGYFKNELKVYGLENKNCFYCKKKSKIKKIIQQGRSTFYCSSCQK